MRRMQGGELTNDLGKTAHGPARPIGRRGDEDKGSPSRDGVNLFNGFDTAHNYCLLNHRKEKIESSAEALQVCQHLFYLSLRNKTLQQGCLSNHADKTVKIGIREISAGVVTVPAF